MPPAYGGCGCYYVIHSSSHHPVALSTYEPCKAEGTGQKQHY